MEQVLQWIGVLGFFISLTSLFFSYKSYKSKQPSVILEQIQYHESILDTNNPTNLIYQLLPPKGYTQLRPSFYLVADLRIVNNSELPISISEFRVNGRRFNSESVYTKNNDEVSLYYQMPKDEFKEKLKENRNVVSGANVNLKPNEYTNLLVPPIKLQPRDSIDGTLIIPFNDLELFNELSTGPTFLSAVGMGDYRVDCFLDLKITQFVDLNR